ncbi:MAG: VOC family protein [Gemmatimonadetes bacterium]|nr:VOC family protein [Gemmatimonadota bacterium]
MAGDFAKITPFLMFDGNAEEAMASYTSLFEDSEILVITRYGADGAGAEGTVELAVFTLNGQRFMCIDSSVKHDFTFTAALSLYVTCDSGDEIERLFENLSQGGEVAMRLAPYPFSARFGWVNDKYGVSWQLNLAEKH